MRFGVLGPLAVWTDAGTVVPIPGAKVRTLLADLLIHSGQPVSADRLVEDVWGGHPPANPAGALQVRVSQLRKAMEQAEPGARELVASRPAGYALQAAAGAVDAASFTELAARAGGTGDPRDRARLLTEALGLWRGPAFADVADEAFAAAAITRLEDQRLAVLEQRAEARLELGEHGLLAGELVELVAHHPLRERLHAAYLRSLYGAGRQSEALEHYARLRHRLADELGLDPGPELVALHRAILDQDPSLSRPSSAVQLAPPAQAPAGPPASTGVAAGAPPGPVAEIAAARRRTNLPAPVTELIGRENAVAELRSLLDGGRLVTLTGAGGVGKTRLALEVARGLVERHPDGVWLVELGALERAGEGDAAYTVADLMRAVLDVRDAAGWSGPDPLVDAIAARDLVLLLDNCEHVVDDVAALVDRLLRGAPAVRVLATSREPLGLPGEVVREVAPLSVPADADPRTLDRSSAVRLFVARATAAARDFVLDERSGPGVALLCQRLDGIPLALELAATRVRALGVDGLVARLDDRFRLLATGHRGAPPRQRTLASMIDWSWDLLSETERTLLRRLAVHVDGCTLEAVEAVCAGDGLDPRDVPDLLARLVDRCMVVLAEGPRYRLLESVAAYCQDHLQRTDELAGLRRRHEAYYLDLAERAQLRGPGQRGWLRRLDAEAANLRAVLDRAVRQGTSEVALRLATALVWYWFLRGRLTEARRCLGAALTGADRVPPRLRAVATAWQVGLTLRQGDATDRAARCAQALRLFDDAGPDDGPVDDDRARAQWFLATASLDSGDLAATGSLLDSALWTFTAAGDRWGEAAVLVTRAKLAHVRGELAALERDASRGAAIFAELGDEWGMLQANEWLAGLAEMTGDYELATRLHTEGLRLGEELGLWPDVAARMGWLAWIALQRRDLSGARELAVAALDLATEQGNRAAEVLAEIVLGFAARRGGDLDVAESHLRRLLELAAGPGPDAPVFLPMVQTELGFLAEVRGDPAGALAWHLAGIRGARALAAPRDLALGLEGMAGALALAGRPVHAVTLLGAAATARASTGLLAVAGERAEVARITAALRPAAGGAFEAAYERGRTLTLGDACALAEQCGAEAGTPPVRPDGTPR